MQWLSSIVICLIFLQIINFFWQLFWHNIHLSQLGYHVSWALLSWSRLLRGCQLLCDGCKNTRDFISVLLYFVWYMEINDSNTFRIKKIESRLKRCYRAKCCLYHYLSWTDSIKPESLQFSLINFCLASEQ